MKTTTNQVRSHRSAARPAPQVKTSREAGAGPQPEPIVRMKIFCGRKLWVRLSLPESIFNKMEFVRKKKRLGLGGYMQRVIRAGLLRQRTNPALAADNGGAR